MWTFGGFSEIAAFPVPHFKRFYGNTFYIESLKTGKKISTTRWRMPRRRHLRRHAGERGTADKAEALSRMRFYLSPFPVSPSPNKRMLIFFHNNSNMWE